jgi:hypothetical protein
MSVIAIALAYVAPVRPHLVMMACILAAVMVWRLVRDGEEDRETTRGTFLMALGIVLLGAVVAASTDAGIPMLDPCESCKKVWPDWMCWLQGCF